MYKVHPSHVMFNNYDGESYSMCKNCGMCECHSSMISEPCYEAIHNS